MAAGTCWDSRFRPEGAEELGGGEEAGGEDEGEDRPRLSPMCGSK